VSEHIVVEKIERVMRVRMDRPQKKNALTGAMYAAMADALEQAEGDDAVRVVLFTGGPKVFTAGNDLNDFLDPERDASGVGRFLATLPGFSKPVIAAVNGHAVGIGTTMLLHCDLVYVGKDAKLRMPFVDLGVVPEFASSLLLPQLVGAQRATELLFFSERIDGKEAKRLGLAAEVLDDDEVQEHALKRAQQLAARAPGALRHTKALLRAENADRIAEVVAREGAIFAEALKSPEAREAMSAIMEKREPDFSKL
jgi:enoyl-CoA hydratase/carnithine racemase